MAQREYHSAFCTWSTPRNDAFQDIEQCAQAGYEAIGLWEAKFQAAEDGKVEEALHASGLRAGILVPHHWTILPTPLDPKGMAQDWKTKSQGICRSIDRLARFKPVAVLVGCGVSGDANKRLGGVEHVVEGLKMAADAAARHDLSIAFEPLALRRGAAVSTLDECVDVLDKTGRANIKLLPDVWHSWPEPRLLANLKACVDRIIGIQVNDVRPLERSWCDRVYPGQGRDACTPIVAALLQAGFTGWYDIEVFSDDGRWGNDFPDSLWKLPHADFVQANFDAFARVFERARRLAASGAVPDELPR